MPENIVELNPQPKKNPVKKWLKRIEKEKDIHEDFRDQAELAWNVYLDDDTTDKIYYPLLWSVVSIEHSAVYSGEPTPDIRPRNTDRNPMFKDAAQIMQRALEFYLDQTDFNENMDRTVDDYLVAGLGVPRVKVDAEIIEMPTGEVDEEGNEETEEIITEQMIRTEHVPYDRFGWEPSSNWDHCEWIYFKHPMTQLEFKRRWPDANYPADEDDRRTDRDKHDHTGVVYEVWDKRNKEVLIIAKGNDEPLEVNDDPLALQEFFPIPKPMMLNLASDELIPTPDYEYIESFDRDINRLYKRSRALAEQIKPWSVHDAGFPELEDLQEVGDGDSVAIENLLDRLEGRGLDSVINFMPLAERVEALAQVTQQIELKRRGVDDLLGISDILRGSSNPMDGQGTQQIKERWAGIRLKRKQRMVQETVRDLFRMMAELTVEHVTPDNLQRMTQVEITPQVYELLRNDLMREFAIDVETDSTIAKDEFQERRERTELLHGLTQFVQIVAPAVGQNVIEADLAREMLQIATDPYKKYSRGLDDVIEQMPTTQQQLGQARQQQAQSAQQMQALQQQMEQMKYALQQYSEREEARKDDESQAKVAKDSTTAQKTQAQIPDETMQPAMTEAEIEYKRAQTIDTLRPDNV